MIGKMCVFIRCVIEELSRGWRGRMLGDKPEVQDLPPGLLRDSPLGHGSFPLVAGEVTGLNSGVQ